MKRSPLSALAATAALFAAAATACSGNDPEPRTATGSVGEESEVAENDGDERGRRGHFRHGHMDPDSFIEHFDEDGNGTLEVAELHPRMAERMKDVDQNGDGRIEAAELAAAFERFKQERFAEKDTNEDGALTADELGDRKWAFLSAADADKDGRLTRNEIDEGFKNGTLQFPRHRGHHKGKGHGGPPSPEKLLERLDQNRNGTIELSELSDHKREWLAGADADNDGSITREELVAHAEQRGRQRFAEKDANRDGFLTSDEVPGRRFEHMLQADANGDQKLTFDELKAAVESGKMGWKGGHKMWRGRNWQPPAK